MYEKLYIQVDFAPIEANDNDVIGINGNWDAYPRKPVEIDDGSFLIDLDADGIDEMVTVAKMNIIEDEEEYIKKELIIKNSSLNVVDSLEYLLEADEIDDINFMFLDLNGDNRLEVIMISNMKGLLIIIYEYNNQKLNEVIDYSIGD